MTLGLKGIWVLARLDRTDIDSWKLGVKLFSIGLFLEQDALLPSKILPHAATLAELVRAVSKAFKEGGRLLYCGAGTSGRLGCLDAAE